MPKMIQIPVGCKLYVISVIIITSLSACLPIEAFNYYRPEAKGGVLSQSACMDSVGPKDLIYFDRDNIKIGLKLNYAKKAYLVNLIFRLPEGGKVSLSHQKIYLNTSEGVHSGKILQKFGMPPWASIDPPTLLNKSGNMLKYTLEARIVAPEQKSVSVSIPKLSIDSKEYELPEVKFVLDSTVEYFTPINC